MHRLTSFAQGTAGVGAIVAYQVGARYAVTTPGAHGVSLVMALLPPLAIALVAATRTTHCAWLLPLRLLVCSVLWMACAPLATHFGWGLYLEHANFNPTMACMFGHTLVAGRGPLCTRSAHIVHGTLTPRIARYSRRVTPAWMLFLLATAAVSTLLFVTASTVMWSAFANYLSLLLVGTMLVAEYLYYRIVLRDEPHSSLFGAMRTYR